MSMQNSYIVTILLLVCIAFSPIFNKDKIYTLQKPCKPQSTIYVTHKEYNQLPKTPHYPKQKPKYIKVS